jgi:hypothetical protein
MYKAIPNIKEFNQRTIVMSMSLYLLKHPTILDGREAQAATNTIPKIGAIALGII